jgi:hypothetical protein
MAIYSDGKHNSEQTETKGFKCYSVSLVFDLTAKNPLEAVEKFRKMYDRFNGEFSFDVTDEETNEKFIVDLDDKENPVSPA